MLLYFWKKAFLSFYHIYIVCVTHATSSLNRLYSENINILSVSTITHMLRISFGSNLAQRYLSNQTVLMGVVVGEWLSSWIAKQRLWFSNFGLVTKISQIGYLLLPSRDMSERLLQRRKTLLKAQSNPTKPNDTCLALLTPVRSSLALRWMVWWLTLWPITFVIQILCMIGVARSEKYESIWGKFVSPIVHPHCVPRAPVREVSSRLYLFTNC